MEDQEVATERFYDALVEAFLAHLGAGALVPNRTVPVDEIRTFINIYEPFFVLVLPTASFRDLRESWYGELRARGLSEGTLVNVARVIQEDYSVNLAAFWLAEGGLFWDVAESSEKNLGASIDASEPRE